MNVQKKIYITECLKIVYKNDFIPSLLILLLKLGLALVPTLQTIFIAEFVDCVTGRKGNLLQDPYIKNIICVMTSLVAYTWIARSLVELLCDHIVMKINAEFKPQLVEKISRLEYYLMEASDIRDRINRVNTKVDTRVKDAYMAMLRLVELILKVIGILAIMFTQVWWASLLILFISIPCFYISMKSGKEEYDAEAEVSKINRVNEYYNEILKNREYSDERTLFRYQHIFMERFMEQYESARKFKTKVKLKWYIRMKAGGMATTIISGGMLAIMVPLTLKGRLSIGMFMALINAVFNIVRNMSWDLTMAIDRNTWFNEYFKDMNYIWELPEVCADLEDKKKLTVFESLEFKDVSFKYPNTKEYILKNVSFKIYANMHYAFVGANGAGKSTIIKLINGLYDGYSGKILVNGRDIREFSQGFLANVFQDFARYPLSIKDNIAIAKQEQISDAELNKIINDVELDLIISKLPNGINTVLGKIKENSVDISGGEWQKLAIARCYASQGQVKILDEPTSAMDPIYETMIYKKFKEICKDKTMILISHRLASVQISDIIFVLDNGTIIEEGSHHDLMKQGGLYETMYNEQAKWYEEDGKNEQ